MVKWLQLLGDFREAENSKRYSKHAFMWCRRFRSSLCALFRDTLSSGISTATKLSEQYGPRAERQFEQRPAQARCISAVGSLQSAMMGSISLRWSR